jgi:hypothetical protein
MARRTPGGSKAQNEIATATAMAGNGNRPAKAYRHKSEKRLTFHRRPLRQKGSRI